MKLVGLMPCRNEDWVLGLSARVALRWCDELILMLHACEDASAEIAAAIAQEHPDRLTVLEEQGPWDEMQHRQCMLTAARQRNATHIAIIDADEVVTGDLLPSLRMSVETAPRGWICEMPGYNLRGGIGQYHKNGIWGERWFSLAFRDHPNLYWRGDRFHHREPEGMRLQPFRPVPHGRSGIMHLWGASERRLRAKHALYKMVETLRWPEKPRADINRQYNLALIPAADPRFDQTWQYENLPDSWWTPYQDLMQHLHVDAEPWQERECRRLYAAHGAARFSGLDLLGVVKVYKD